jgi:signal transduction histidine kinase
LLGLPDGRWLLAGRVHGGHRVSIGFVASIAIIAVAVALAAYPVVRRLTRRLETLQRSVEALGAGDLSARVAIEGRDEVAALAASFNRSAERIEALLRSQRSLLANTSHELRSPLARLRLALELGETQPQAEWIDEVKRNIAEIDVLLDEILLASRLDAGLEQDLPRELVHLDALVIEECARYGAACDTEPTRITGNDALLRRLLRNLLQNAQRYGGGTATVALRGDGHVTRLSVTDHGPGVPDAERERVFEPFYRLPAAPPGGTGLGLALVRQIARNHGGDASCEPAPSGGASFVVRLPVQESSTTDSPSNTR